MKNNKIWRFFQQLATSIDQRLVRIEQVLLDEPNLINSIEEEIQERLDIVEKLKHQVKVNDSF